MLSNRSRLLNDKPSNVKGKYIALWLKRDFRFSDNWAFVEAIKYAKYYSLPLKVFVYLPSKLYQKDAPTKYCILFPSYRHYDFLLKSLIELEKELTTKGIPLEFITGNSPSNALKEYFNKSVLVITDFKPTIPALECDNNVKTSINVQFIQIDSHNIVPIWKASQNAEYMARTIRSKLWNNSKEFLVKYPDYEKFKQPDIKSKNKIIKLDDLDLIDDTYRTSTKPGYKEGMKRFKHFIKNNLQNYDKRNDPTIENAQSNMSIYINYGTVSAQQLVFILKYTKNISKYVTNLQNIEDYIEEVWIRRELAENYCYYKDYTSVDSAWDWAKKLMKKDNYTQKYNLQQLENAQTNDEPWNASQKQLVTTGKLHGYMRMYWAKKISEWCKNRQNALDIANYLNDKYEMDGSDSGGYTGTAWSIIGVHDRNFYGKFRPMTLAGLKSKKIDINKYINKYL
tara:strand:+ start:2514 stop:3872 length:1359 start_codon:yes stop_codon:yes gene_type:complete